MMRMDINTLISGMVVGRDIILDDVLLVKKGQELTPHLIHRLKGYGITYVDIVSDKEKAKQDYVINEDVYDKIVETIKSNDPEEIKSAAN